MKYLIIFFFGLVASLSFAQSSELNQVSKLIGSFEAEKDLTNLEEAESLITDLFAKRDFEPSAQAYFSKAKVMSLLLRNKEIEDPLTYAQDLKASYSSALAADTEMKLRYDILNELYLSKARLTELGNISYEEKDFENAHAYYKTAFDYNAIEVAHPRHMTVDTSLLFTSAVFGSLAKKNKEAITDFERLVEMEYNREDLYDYLIRLYQEEGMEAKAKNIQKLKDLRFPKK